MGVQSLPTSHRQTDAQPVSEQWPLCKNSLPGFIAEHDAPQSGLSLGAIQVSCP